MAESASTFRTRLEPGSIVDYLYVGWKPLVEWLAARRINSLGEVDEDVLAAYREHVLGLTGLERKSKERKLYCVVRLWLMAPYLPSEDQLPQPPWDNQEIAERLDSTLGPRASRAENATKPIHPETMAATITAALHLVTDCSETILQAALVRDAMVSTSRKLHGRGQLQVWRQYLDDLRRTGGTLPGVLRGGRTMLAAQYLSGMLGVDRNMIRAYRPDDIPVRAGAPLDITVEGRIQGQPWAETIDFYEVNHWTRRLATACLIVVAYLSGMRAQECLGLRRGCCRRADPDDELAGYEIHGKEFKVTGPDGNAIPGGRERDHPWFVIDPVAKAVSVLERLQPHSLLFPVAAFDSWHQSSAERSQRPWRVSGAIQQFVAWWNDAAAMRGWTTIPPEPPGPDGREPRITISRFRRTVAWFVYRLPHGLISLGIQYGHIDLDQTARYGSRVESGFGEVMEERAFALRDFLEAASARREEGEGVSGPAAEGFLSGIEEYRTKFGGQVMDERDYQDMLKNPKLHIYDSPHQCATCIYDDTVSKCNLDSDHLGQRVVAGPNPQHCDPACGNISRTDENIRDLQRSVERLRAEVASPVVPEPIKKRNRQIIAKRERIIEEHRIKRIASVEDGT